MKNLKLFLIIFVALIVLSPAVQAAETINLPYNTSTHIRFSRNIARVFVGSQRIATVKQPTAAMNEIVITALEKTGSTTVFVWTDDGAQHEYTVTVYDNQRGEAAIIEREIGLPNVQVKKIGGRVLLQGTVADENEHQHAVRIAQFHVGGTVTTTDKTTGIETTSESADAAKANIIDNLKVLNPDTKNADELQIERVIGLPNISVKKIGNRLLLQGTVENEDERQHALNIAALFLENETSSYTATFDTSSNQYNSDRKNRVGAFIVDEIKILNPFSKTTIETQIEQSINLPSVQVKKIGNSVMLTGTVANEREHIHAVQVATVFANNVEVEGNSELDNNVRIMEYRSVSKAEVSKINVIDRLEVLNSKTILEEEIENAIGLPNVRVKKIDERLLLTGTVKNQYERNYAIQVARLFIGSGTDSSLNFGSNVNPSISTKSYDDDGGGETLAEDDKAQSSGNIIDLLQMLNPLKIRLEAQIVEINSDKAKDLGITYGQSGEGNRFSFGEEYNRTATTTTYTYFNNDTGRYESYSISDGGDVANFVKRPLRWIEHRFGPINATIHALVSDGKARILSRPSVTTLSGEQATIQIGGRIPYQSYSSSGVPKTDFENYGIILQFKPIVDAQNRIVTTVHTEVSNLSGQSVDGQPIISTRLADSVINLDSGSTMIIGGLMDSSESKAISKIPLLGNIPILGEFFKYTSKRRDKRELIILVTPYIVEEPSVVGMTGEMRDYYHAGQREKMNMQNIDLDEPPPPLPEKNKKSKTKKTPAPNKTEPAQDKTDTPEKNSGWSFGAGIFGDAF